MINPKPTLLSTRRARRWIFISALFVAVSAVPIYRYSPRIYSRWHQASLLRQAQENVKKGELRKASLCLRQVLMEDRTNLEALRAMAALAEQAGVPEAGSWWERVTMARLATVEDARAWVRTSLKLAEPEDTEKAMAHLQTLAPDDPTLHEITGGRAWREGRLAEAEAHFTRLAELEPEQERHQLVLATLRLEMGDSVHRAQALATLDRLQKLPEFRRMVLRVLSGFEMRDLRGSRALGHLEELVADPAATFEDHLLQLSALQQLAHPSLSAELRRQQRRAQNHEQEAADLILWMVGRDLTASALEWSATLPGEMTAKMPLVAAVAEAHLKLSDWKSLHASTAQGSWAAQEIKRLVYLARALKGLDDPSASQIAWDEAVALTAKRSQGLKVLERIASSWNWEAKSDSLQWRLAKFPKEQRAALQTLQSRYKKRQDTRSLLRVWAALAEADAADKGAANSWNMLALLVGDDLQRAGTLARKLYEEDPTNPAMASTYAFAAHLQGRTGEALKTMRSLKAEDLQEPAVATYYGILLAANGEVEDARKFLEQVPRELLLPEELRLVELAKQSLL